MGAEISIENCSNLVSGTTNTPVTSIGTENSNTTPPSSIAFSTIKGGQNNDLTSIKLYPNPIIDRLNVKLENPIQQDGVIRVYDIWGKLLQDRRIISGTSQVNLNLDNLTSGVYFIEVQEGEKAVRKRVVKR